MFTNAFGGSMIANTGEMQKTSAVATTEGGGSIWSGANNFLNGALDIWGKVEQIKAAKSSQGVDQQQAMHQPELANGAAVQVDQNLSGLTEIAGVKVDKRLLAVSGAALLIALLLKKSS